LLGVARCVLRQKRAQRRGPRRDRNTTRRRITASVGGDGARKKPLVRLIPRHRWLSGMLRVAVIGAFLQRASSVVSLQESSFQTRAPFTLWFSFQIVYAG